MSVQQNSNGEFSQVTVYRATPLDEHNAEAVVRKLKVQDEVKAFREQRDFEHKHKDDPPPPPTRKKGRFADVILAVQLAFGIGLGITAIQMLRIVMR